MRGEFGNRRGGTPLHTASTPLPVYWDDSTTDNRLSPAVEAPKPHPKPTLASQTRLQLHHAATTDEGSSLAAHTHRQAPALALATAVALALACALPARTALADGLSDGAPAIGVGTQTSSAGDRDVTAAKFDDASGTDESAALESAHPHTTYVVHKLGPTETDVAPGVYLEDGVVVVREDQGWRSGEASAYTLACNDGWDATASGVKLTEDSMTVAVPADRVDLLGRTVEIYYNGVTVTATVTDTGGFAAYGRDLDLAGGVWRALGASSTEDWGVRTVSYRFV